MANVTSGFNITGNITNGTSNYYDYTPSRNAGIAFVVLFSLSAIIHMILSLKTRVRWCIVLVIGSFGEAIGWGGRLWSHYNKEEYNAFIMQIVSLIISPVFFSAALYVTLHRVINEVGRKYSILSPKIYVFVFCVLDLVSLVVQAVGGAMAAGANDGDPAQKNGTHIMVGGIIVQLVGMVIFSFLGLIFVFRAFRATGHTITRPVRILLLGMFFSSCWVLVRCVYRVFELAQGWTGFLISHEVYFIVLDGVPMIIACSTLIFTHPGVLIPRRQKGEVIEDRFEIDSLPDESKPKYLQSKYLHR